ncbi:Uncharacterized protein FWK35_00015754 [Aphis craccivora]|uniref:Uncharacterized protein n=1 Tax=Aphis craccivora TaxID=307492 RepID=A0A6G0Z0K5_APHCR|nr:Uncharacterized protein FWK35_00015754 [Aphis craccivora]
MMCVFFVSVYSITSRNNAPISTLGVVSDAKVNILGALYRSKVNIFQQFLKKSRKTKINDGKREFLRKICFRPNRFFYMVVIQKLITENT